jgi:RNA polymerase sigma-70 factor, ECF subfamily
MGVPNEASPSTPEASEPGTPASEPAALTADPASASSAGASPDALYHQLVTTYGPSLTRLARAYELDATLREDLLQDIHVALWHSLSTFDGRCSLRTWTYRVAHNTALTHVTRNRKHRQRSFCTLDELEQTPDPYNAEELTNREQVVERLSHLINRLHPLDRQVMLLYLEDIDANDIAAVTGLTPTNVATKIHRIKTLLARYFHAGDTP